MAWARHLGVSPYGTGTNSANSVSQGQPEATRFVAARSGTVTVLAMFIAAANASTSARLALYSEGATTPVTRLSAEGIFVPVAGRWNFVQVPATTIVSGTSYWIAYLSTAGVLSFSDNAASGGTTLDSTTGGQTTLPATWAGPNSATFANVPNVAALGRAMASGRAVSAVQHASTWCKRHRGILVPDLWLPTPARA